MRIAALLRTLVGCALVLLAVALPRLVLSSLPSTEPPSPPGLSGSTKSEAPGSSALRDLSSVPRVASYALRAKLDASAHEIEGEGTIEFRNVSRAPKNDLYVHLYLNAFENAETVFGRRDGSGFRGTSGLTRFGHIEVEQFYVREMNASVWPEGATTEGDPKDRTDIRVPLPRPIAVGEVIHIDVRFKSTLPSVLLRTGFAGSFHMAGQWFPKIAKLEPDGTWAHFPFQRFSEFYSDFGDYDVTVDVPEAFVVGATGAMSESRIEGGRRVVRYRASGVHDFAFTAWDGFDERDIDDDGVSVRCLFPKGYDASATRELEAVRDGLTFYGRAYGAYPYATLTVVHPPDAAEEAGGMEYPTLITTGGPFILPYSDTRAVELLTLHELAHQWFYGLVATNENAYPFLDEGLTTFAAGEAAAALYGDHPLLTALSVSVPAGERIYAKHVVDRAPVASRAEDFRTGSDYAQLVYYRTATILRTLDRVVPGVSTRALASYARAERFEHPGPTELLTAFDSAGGSAVREAFSAAIFDKAAIDLSVDRFAPGALAVTVRRSGALALPADVNVTDVYGTTQRFVWDGRGTFVTLKSETPIARAEVDPDGKVLLDENLLNNGATLEPPSAPRIFFAALLLGGLATSEVGP